jgi:hypothetical protein
MRPKKANTSARVCALVFFVVLSATALTAAPALALPEGRVYEQVSPEFKAGYPVFSVYNALALDGESMRFDSVGAFSGSGEDFALNPDVARRTANGWVTSGLFPSETSGVCWQGLEQMSTDLSRFEYLVRPGSTAVACQESPTITVGLREPDGSFVQASPAMTDAPGEINGGRVVAVSNDLSRFVISNPDSTKSHFVSGDETQSGSELIEVEASSLRLVALNNEGSQLTRYCNVWLGGASGGAFGAVSQPGASEVVFSLDVDTRTVDACNGNTSHPEEVFVRLGGQRTLEVSKPFRESCSEVPCPGATSRAPAVFQGASEDGSRVFFTTTAPLLSPESNDTSNNLYMASIGCPGGEEECEAARKEVTSLVQVSRDPHAGQPAEVEPHVLAISPDGLRVYFVAHGVLSEGANDEGEAPVQGAENLYVYDGAKTPARARFIADLCSGPEASGSAHDVHCPVSLNENTIGETINDTTLWAVGAERSAQTTGNGAFLVFQTYARLVRNGPESDSDNARDVYRYNLETGGLRRVSVGEGGFDGNGNNDAFDASIAPTRFLGALQDQYELGSRAVSEDGSTVVFTTSEPLSVRAINGRQDVYVWHEGHVGMISSGTASEPDEKPIITPSGRDIVFTTNAGLVPGDTDGLKDTYDARVGGGFPLVAAPREPCSGDACQGPLSAPAPLLVPGSVAQAPWENLPASKALVKQKNRPKAKCKRGYRRDKHGRCVKVKKRGRKAAVAGPRGQKSSRGGRS